MALIIAFLAVALLLAPQPEGSRGAAWSILAREPPAEPTSARFEETIFYKYSADSRISVCAGIFRGSGERTLQGTRTGIWTPQASYAVETRIVETGVPCEGTAIRSVTWETFTNYTEHRRFAREENADWEEGTPPPIPEEVNRRDVRQYWGPGTYTLIGEEVLDGIPVYHIKNDFTDRTGTHVTHFYLAKSDLLLRKLIFESIDFADEDSHHREVGDPAVRMLVNTVGIYQELRWYDINQPVVFPTDLPK